MHIDLFHRIATLIERLTGGNETAFARKIGAAQATLNRNMKARANDKLMDLTGRILLAFPEVSREWLLAGEGDMLRKETPQAARPTSGGITPFPVPIVGLAACGLEGIEQIMPYAITASPIHLGPRSVAVVAYGESMVPAGIASGHMCFCDPDQQALPGEAVFFRRKDDKGALKLFLGSGTLKGHTAFKGWLPARDDRGHQKEFTMDIPDDEIDYIAPVVFVRRRL